MIFLAAATEPTVFLMLTEQDLNDMRGGRTKYVDKTATGGATFDRIVVSVHRNQAEIEDMLRRAGHGALLKGMASLKPTKVQEVCAGCKGNMDASMLLDGMCVACWRDSAKAYKKMSEGAA
jgi:hypothetical protein